jgi:hypothetical protein
MRLSPRLLPVALALSAFPALATAGECHLSCESMTPEARAEYQRAHMVAKLDCNGLNAYVEQQRWLMNQRTLAEYQRFMLAPQATPVAPAAAPATPAAPAVPPRPR